MNSLSKHGLLFLLTAVIMLACGENNSNPAKEMIGRLSLKRGKLISCGPPQKEFGIVDFDMPFNEKVKKDFNVAIELLHSFEYDESEKVFAKIIDESPGCAMAYWVLQCAIFILSGNHLHLPILRKGKKLLKSQNL